MTRGLTVMMAMAAMATAAAGCSRTLVRGEVVYRFAWSPDDGPDVELTALEGSETISAFYASADEASCDPAVATAATMEIEGGLQAFTKAHLGHVAWTGAWAAPAAVEPLDVGSTTQASFAQPSTATDPTLSLTGAVGDGSAALTVTVAVETWCGEVWK
ncbi:MAG: hypothetical protein EP329_13200 [Deltaproteobacteria bacterium]|nr:MAG: hypothetical protein EP329_13200 [Deltaproteobacteria bacterium]